MLVDREIVEVVEKARLAMERHIQIPPRIALILTILFVPVFAGVGYLFWRIASLPAGLEYKFMYQTVGTMFISGGLLLCLSRISENIKSRAFYKWAEYATILPIWFGFVIVFLWISLGRGIREFEFSISAGGINAEGPLYPLIGRILFGLGAILVGRGAVTYTVRRPMEILGLRAEEIQEDNAT